MQQTFASPHHQGFDKRVIFHIIRRVKKPALSRRKRIRFAKRQSAARVVSAVRIVSIGRFHFFEFQTLFETLFSVKRDHRGERPALCSFLAAGTSGSGFPEQKYVFSLPKQTRTAAHAEHADVCQFETVLQTLSFFERIRQNDRF